MKDCQGVILTFPDAGEANTHIWPDIYGAHMWHDEWHPDFPEALQKTPYAFKRTVKMNIYKKKALRPSAYNEYDITN